MGNVHVIMYPVYSLKIIFFVCLNLTPIITDFCLACRLVTG